MSAERLREAAALMRSRASVATSGPWEFRPRRGFQSANDNPATIGFVDTAGYFVMLREGTWTTEGDMTYVASWHPAVALAVADWLDYSARCFDAAVEWNAERDADDMVAWAREPAELPDLACALAVANAYLGGRDE